MRLSEFQINMVQLIGSMLGVVFTFLFDFGYIMPEFNKVLFQGSFTMGIRIGAVFTFILYSSILSDELTDMIAYKYRIIEGDTHVEVRYLTVWWLFIPFWNPIDFTYRKYDFNDIFGHPYISEDAINYKVKKEAIQAIEIHRKERKNKLKQWFEKPKKKNERVTYF